MKKPDIFSANTISYLSHPKKELTPYPLLPTQRKETTNLKKFQKKRNRYKT